MYYVFTRAAESGMFAVSLSHLPESEVLSMMDSLAAIDMIACQKAFLLSVRHYRQNPDEAEEARVVLKELESSGPDRDDPSTTFSDPILSGFEESVEDRIFGIDAPVKIIAQIEKTMEAVGRERANPFRSAASASNRPTVPESLEALEEELSRTLEFCMEHAAPQDAAYADKYALPDYESAIYCLTPPPALADMISRKKLELGPQRFGMTHYMEVEMLTPDVSTRGGPPSGPASMLTGILMTTVKEHVRRLGVDLDSDDGDRLDDAIDGLRDAADTIDAIIGDASEWAED